jgi:hypothetical protein
MSTPPGSKVRVTNAPVRNGILLLEPSRFSLEGGRVEELFQEWSTHQRVAGGARGTRRVGGMDGSGPPPFVPFQKGASKPTGKQGARDQGRSESAAPSAVRPAGAASEGRQRPSDAKGAAPEVPAAARGAAAQPKVVVKLRDEPDVRPQTARGAAALARADDRMARPQTARGPSRSEATDQRVEAPSRSEGRSEARLPSGEGGSKGKFVVAEGMEQRTGGRRGGRGDRGDRREGRGMREEYSGGGAQMSLSEYMSAKSVKSDEEMA